MSEYRNTVVRPGVHVYEQKEYVSWSMGQTEKLDLRSIF